MNWNGVLSKKLMVAAVAVFVIIFGDEFGLDYEQLEALKVTVGGYLVGQGVADFGKGKAQAEAKKTPTP